MSSLGSVWVNSIVFIRKEIKEKQMFVGQDFIWHMLS